MKKTVWLDKKEYNEQQDRLNDCIIRLNLIKKRLEKAILHEIKEKK